MPLAEIRGREVGGVEEVDDEGRLERGGVRGGVLGREVGGEGPAGLEVEGREEGSGDGEGGRVVLDVGGEGRGEDLDFEDCGGGRVEGFDEVGVGVGGGRGGRGGRWWHGEGEGRWWEEARLFGRAGVGVGLLRCLEFKTCLHTS